MWQLVVQLFRMPLVGGPNSFLQGYSRPPSERKDSGHVHQLSGCAIGPGLVERYISLEANDPPDSLSKLANREICPDADSDDLRILIHVDEVETRRRTVVHVAELAPRPTRSPELNLRGALGFCFMKLPN